MFLYILTKIKSYEPGLSITLRVLAQFLINPLFPFHRKKKKKKGICMVVLRAMLLVKVINFLASLNRFLNFIINVFIKSFNKYNSR